MYKGLKALFEQAMNDEWTTNEQRMNRNAAYFDPFLSLLVATYVAAFAMFRLPLPFLDSTRKYICKIRISVVSLRLEVKKSLTNRNNK